MNILFLCLLFLSFQSKARNLSPKELAELAETRAPLIVMGLEGKKAAQSQVSQSKLIANPVFTVQSGSLKSGTASGSVVDLTINQPIPWPGKRSAEINSAKILENISEVDLEEARLKVHHSTSLLALELAIMGELEKHNKERRKRFSLIHQYLVSHPLASPKQKIDKDLIETQIKLVETQMYDLETRIKSVGEQLKYLSGEEVNQITVNWFLPGPPSYDYFLTKIENNSTYRRSQKLSQLAENRIEQAEYLAKPDLLVGVNYRQENLAPTNHFLHANFAVVIPIIDRGQHSVEVARANARKEEASKKLVLLESNVSLNKSYQSLLSAFRSTEIFKVSNISHVERRFEDAEQAFRKGQIDVITFLQTDTLVHESVDTAYLSYIKYYTALSETHLLIGQKLEIK